MKTFSDLGLDTRILKAITELGFERPMPVQAEVLPVALNHETDIVALAQTGTGKTAAFALPCIQKLDTSNNHTEVVVLCPTRELCVQITNDFKNFAKYVEGASVLAVYGGSSIEAQKRTLKKGAKVIVATPGRLVDLCERGYVDLSHVRQAILDESDEMLNMGFKDDLDFILSKTPKTKNTYLFSATMPIEVERIAKNYMNDPVEITIGSKNSGSKNVHHYFYLVQARDRYHALKRIADYYPNIYSIVFCRTRAEAQDVADSLIRDGYNADALHGELSQAQRDAVMKRFRNRQLQMLVATDVAARGLDVNDLTHVINYNLPDEVEQYTHRSGRTGRADKTGISIAIINVKEKHKIKQIEKIIGQQFTQVKVPNGHEICEKQLFHIIDNIENMEVLHDDIDGYLPLITKRLEWISKEDLIRRFVSVEFGRFLDYYRNAPDLNVSEAPREPREKRGEFNGRHVQGNYTRLFMNIGRKDKADPKDIIQLINRGAGSRDVNIGRIDILDMFSYVDVDTQYVQTVIEALNGTNFHRRQLVVDPATPRGEQPRERKKSFNKKEFGNDERKPAFGGKKKEFGAKKKKDFGGGKKFDKKGGKKKKW